MTGRSDPAVARFGNMDKMNPGCFVGLNPGQDRRHRSEKCVTVLRRKISTTDPENEVDDNVGSDLRFGWCVVLPEHNHSVGQGNLDQLPIDSPTIRYQYIDHVPQKWPESVWVGRFKGVLQHDLIEPGHKHAGHLLVD